MQLHHVQAPQALAGLEVLLGGMPDLSASEMRKRNSFFTVSKKERLALEVERLEQRSQLLQQQLEDRKRALAEAAEDQPQISIPQAEYAALQRGNAQAVFDIESRLRAQIEHEYN